MDGLVWGIIGFLVGALLAIGGADRVIEAYAGKERLYRIGDKLYEIKEVK